MNFIKKLNFLWADPNVFQYLNEKFYNMHFSIFNVLFMNYFNRLVIDA